MAIGIKIGRKWQKKQHKAKKQAKKAAAAAAAAAKNGITVAVAVDSGNYPGVQHLATQAAPSPALPIATAHAVPFTGYSLPLVIASPMHPSAPSAPMAMVAAQPAPVTPYQHHQVIEMQPVASMYPTIATGYAPVAQHDDA